MRLPFLSGAVLALTLLTGHSAVGALDERLEVALAGEHREPANRSRDAYRHPREVLEFFGMTPQSTVVEIWPSRGWWTELLAPVLRPEGDYYAAGFALFAQRTPDWRKDMQRAFENKLAAHPEIYDAVQVTELSVPEQTRIAPPGSADLVLTFRNVHNWMKGDYALQMFEVMARALKPGGVLGVVEHRAKPGTSLEEMRRSGYVTEAQVIAFAEQAGLELEARSEINANPRDDRDHPAGVWTLPPSLRHCRGMEPAADREACLARYRAIGESDRMTLKFRKPGGEAAHSGVNWRDWSPATFAEAARRDRLIFLDVGIEGCTACRNMERVTYADAAVAERLNDHFVAIKVDAESRPDLGERYSDWAWPALVFMTPDAKQVLALRGNRLPQNFLPVLEELRERQQAGTLTLDAAAPYAAVAEPLDTDLTALRDRLRRRLDGELEDAGRRSTSGARLQQAFLRAHMYGDDVLERTALDAAANYLDMLDPVWGGVFVAALPDGRFVPEKRLSNQADALHVFAEAYLMTGEARFATAIRSVHEYLTGHMSSPRGTFFTSQQNRPAALPAEVDTARYWAADDAGRRRWGLPATDKAVYTDKNGQVIAALAAAYAATGEVALLDTAVRAAEALLAGRRTEAGWLLQSADADWVDDTARLRPMETEERPYLAAQAWFGSALLALHGATGEARWLDHAVTVATALESQLLDEALGGFFATVPEPQAVVAPRKPLELNARTAHFLYDLAVLRKQPRLAAMAEDAIRAAATPEAVRREGRVTGELALALETLTAAYVEFSVVSRERDGAAWALFKAARSVHHPRKVLHFEAPGRYPDRGDAALYICNPDICSVPITDAADVAAQARRHRDPALTPAFVRGSIGRWISNEPHPRHRCP